MAKNDDLNQRVTEAIQAQIMGLIPEDELRQRVDNEIEKFFSPTKSPYHGGPITPSPFAKLVEQELTKVSSKYLSDLFNSKEWTTSVSESGELIVGETLQKVMGVSPDAFRDTLARSMAKSYALQVVQVLQISLYSQGQTDLANDLTNYVRNIR